MDGQAGKDLQGSHSDSGTGTGAPSRERHTPGAGGGRAEKGHLTVGHL